MTSLNQFRGTGLRIVIMFALFALSPASRAVTPAPDGGYPNANTAEGDQALQSLTDGTDNTAIGAAALFHNIDGTGNTATGSAALYSNSTGFFNTATGIQALFSNTTGSANTATGVGALNVNSTGANNTATGFRALYYNTTGSYNTVTGFDALSVNQAGGGNTAIGAFGLSGNTTGSYNTAIGALALYSNTSGNSNVALGLLAGSSLTTGNNNIDIGNFGVAAESTTIRLGAQGVQTATYIAGIFGTTSTGSLVGVDSTGHLGVLATSSARFKDDTKPMNKASEAILALKPVTFRYKKEIDSKGIPQFGLVAEQVEKVNPDLVTRDAEGKLYTVRYDAINAMLLNEFLKEHKKVEEQQAAIAELKSTVAQQQKGSESKLARQEQQIKALTGALQKVSAQLPLIKSAPQTVKNTD